MFPWLVVITEEDDPVSGLTILMYWTICDASVETAGINKVGVLGREVRHALNGVKRYGIARRTDAATALDDVHRRITAN